MNYRKATINDIDALVIKRKTQLADEGIASISNIDEELASYFSSQLKEETLIEWLVEDEGQIIATAAIAIQQFPPTYSNKTGKKGYITNMYTRPEYRGQGIATKLLNKLVEEANQEKISTLWLGASKMGRPVYKNFGFKETKEWLEMNL